MPFFDYLFYNFLTSDIVATSTSFYDPNLVKTDPTEPTDKELKKLEKHGKKQLANTLKSNSAKKDQADKFISAAKARKDSRLK